MGLSDDFKFFRNRLTHQQILGRMAELEDEPGEYDLTISDSARARARQTFDRLGLPAGRPVVGINTGCGPVFETKAWTESGFTELIRSLGEDGRVSVLLLGGTREAELHERLTDVCGDLTGRTVFDAGTDNPLEDFFALVDVCGVVVSTDSLAMHVGIALKKRVVAFFGPTCEQEIDLFGRGEKIVTDYDCSPCYLKTCDVRPSCMQALSAETVEAAVRRQLAALDRAELRA